MFLHLTSLTAKDVTALTDNQICGPREQAIYWRLSVDDNASTESSRSYAIAADDAAIRQLSRISVAYSAYSTIEQEKIFAQFQKHLTKVE